MDLQNLHWMVLEGEYSSTNQSWKGNAQGVGVFSECLRDQIEGNRTSLRLCLGSKSLVVTRMWGHLYSVSYHDTRKSHIPSFISFRHSIPCGWCFTDFYTWSKPSVCSLLPTVAFLFLKSKLVRSWIVLECFGW